MIKKASHNLAELKILRLAAMAVDLRTTLTAKEIQRVPSLSVALGALERVLEEMGWADGSTASRSLGKA
jgi:hypothetical protein